MTRAEIRTAITALGYETTNATQMNEAIASVDRRINGMRRWPWDELTDTFTTTASDFEYEMTLITPIAARAIDAIYIDQGTNNRPDLDFIPYAEIREYIHLDNRNGRPRYWSRRGNNIYLYPIPDGVYTLTVDFVREWTSTQMDGDSDVPVIPVSYHDLYVFGGAAQLAMRQRDWSSYNGFMGQFNERLREMIGEVRIEQRQNARQVVRSTFWRTVHSPPGAEIG